MKKSLVAYFSASGTTAAVAKTLAEAAGADLYEIKPQTAYTRADLDWTNKKSRSSVEMNDQSSRPPLSDKDARIEDYDTIFLGFPIWWSSIPASVRSFLMHDDFSGKTIVPFCSMGGGRFGQTISAIAKLAPNSVIKEGLEVTYSSYDRAEISEWLSNLTR